MSQETCSFCNFAKDPSQKIVFQNELVLFCIKEKQQGSLKHSGVIIPRQHRETVFDLTDEEVLATFKMLKEVRDWLGSTVQPDGYNIGWNCGTVGGQLEFHAHMHVIPRFKQEPLAGQGIRSHLKGDQNQW